ncbi:MAG: hypothetical protein R2737_03110 [Candidatus Nanopelagicales bacterium]
MLLPVVVALLAGAAPARAADDAGADPAAVELAERYAPVVVIRQQEVECGPGEPYLPTSVDVVLGRNDVVLRGPDGAVVTTAPTAADLFGLGDGYYLDLPGNPLDPGCTYEEWFREVARDLPPTVYARVATDPAHPEQLAVQYWFFWVFNDWNDKHEGDWEMVQLLFDADTAEQALASEPTTVAYAQHEGSETADWSSDKVLRDGDHPAVYPGQGSHAAYFTQAQWFGKSAAAGFGCDDTTAPGEELRPEVVLLPDAVTSANDPFAWLGFTGRWGQKEASFNNGPTGPNTKDQWDAPVTWVVDEGRPDAVALPPLPGEAVDAFCGLTAAGSLLFVDLMDSPWIVVGVLAVLVALLALGIARTRWRPVSVDPVDQQRRAGQIVLASFRLVLGRPAVFVPLALITLASTVLVGTLQRVLLEIGIPEGLTDVRGTTGAWLPQLLAGLLTLLVAFPLYLWVVTATARAVGYLAEGSTATPGRALGEAARHPRAAVTVVVQQIVPAVLVATLLLSPLGLWLLARWAVAYPAAATEGAGIRASLRRSATLTKGHRWRTLWLTLLVLLGAAWVGPLVGALLLLVTGVPFWVANLATGIVAALLVVVSATAFALQLLDLRTRIPTDEQVRPGAPGRRR